jgi:hypothetical protein
MKARPAWMGEMERILGCKSFECCGLDGSV